LRAHRFCFRNIALAVAFAIAPASAALAQSIPDDIPEDFYRAELVILERLVDPVDVEERMAGKEVEPPVSSTTDLWVDGEDGSRSTDLQLVDTEELHLNQAIQRLERSGNYRVLASAGWYRSFPPDYDTGPMRVAIGDWLESAGQREIEGHISIERQRYLHVEINLNHWQVDEAALAEARAATQADTTMPTETQTREDNTRGSDSNQVEQSTDSARAPVSMETVAPELLTWIRETRRMRSGAIHFIDSPTIGVLVYFEPIEEEE